MSAQLSGWLAQAWATDSPVLPTSGAMQLWLHLGWSVVLACLGVSIAGGWLKGRRLGRQVPWLFGLGLAVWAWLPGSTGAAYWFGLAFQAPSVAGVLLCLLLLARRARGNSSAQMLMFYPGAAYSDDGQSMWLASVGALLGWALLLDSFAVLPLQLYSWGFSPMALGAVVLAAPLPWAVSRQKFAPGTGAVRLVVPLAALVFVVWRLPTGNLWDAVMDPWTWVVLQVWLLKRGWSRYKNSS
jgi:hypothetical protein